MTVAEIIAEQRRKCEADRQAKLNRRTAPTLPTPPPKPAKLKPADVERAYIEDRTYDGKVPEGGMAGIMRRENPEEYVARDGTRTFVPWRYVSMQDLELPDGGNPYRKPEQDDQVKKNFDPWGRPSGYVGSAAGQGMSPEYDPWAISGSVPLAQGGSQAGWDDWLAPAPMQPPVRQEPPKEQTGGWDSWMAPATESVPEAGEQTPTLDTNGTLDIMRSMRP